jgi:hypothetical protein
MDYPTTRLEVVVRFVDIGGIGDHYCLNFLFKILFAQIYGHVTNRAGNHYRKKISMTVDLPIVIDHHCECEFWVNYSILRQLHCIYAI